MSAKIRIAQIQQVPEKGNLKRNHENLMSILEEATKEKADIVVTPECFLDGYVATETNVSAEKLRKYAIDLSGVDVVRQGATAHLRDRRPDVYAGQSGGKHGNHLGNLPL